MCGLNSWLIEAVSDVCPVCYDKSNYSSREKKTRENSSWTILVGRGFLFLKLLTIESVSIAVVSITFSDETSIVSSILFLSFRLSK